MGRQLSFGKALRHFGDQLTDFEQSEVLDYPQVYFLGRKEVKIRAGLEAGADNHGYDDERGDYALVSGDHLHYRYEVLSLLGKGSFGQVLRCYDHKAKAHTAVKVIRNKKRFHQQALVEVKVLEHLRHRDPDDASNVVHMQEYFYFRSHLCISFELLSINLYEFLKSNAFQGLSQGLIRRFAQQLLVALRFLARHRVIHCDLKPENVLLRTATKSAIKVIDFGSSCFEDECVYTYIQSRFYRSPEVIMGLAYSVNIDIWSLGCILAELYTGYPLFPGENEAEQLACIMEVLGPPPRAMLALAVRRKLFFDSSGAPRPVTNSRGKKRRVGAKDLPTVLRCSDPLFLHFLEGCLQWEVADRLTPDTALAHPWITGDADAAAALLSISTAATTAAGVVAEPAAVPRTPQPPPPPLAPKVPRLALGGFAAEPAAASTPPSAPPPRGAASERAEPASAATVGGVATARADTARPTAGDAAPPPPPPAASRTAFPMASLPRSVGPSLPVRPQGLIGLLAGGAISTGGTVAPGMPYPHTGAMAVEGGDKAASGTTHTPRRTEAQPGPDGRPTPARRTLAAAYSGGAWTGSGSGGAATASLPAQVPPLSTFQLSHLGTEPSASSLAAAQAAAMASPARRTVVPRPPQGPKPSGVAPARGLLLSHHPAAGPAVAYAQQVHTTVAARPPADATPRGVNRAAAEVVTTAATAGSFRNGRKR